MMISPYALLKASKPKPPESLTTSYDLFSLAGSVSSSGSSAPQQEETPLIQAQSAATPSIMRTHYIADIHARHAGAMRRARQRTDLL